MASFPFLGQEVPLLRCPDDLSLPEVLPVLQRGRAELASMIEGSLSAEQLRASHGNLSRNLAELTQAPVGGRTDGRLWRVNEMDDVPWCMYSVRTTEEVPHVSGYC